jgi:hypothetical protein
MLSRSRTLLSPSATLSRPQVGVNGSPTAADGAKSVRVVFEVHSPHATAARVPYRPPPSLTSAHAPPSSRPLRANDGTPRGGGLGELGMSTAGGGGGGGGGSAGPFAGRSGGSAASAAMFSRPASFVSNFGGGAGMGGGGGLPRLEAEPSRAMSVAARGGAANSRPSTAPANARAGGGGGSFSRPASMISRANGSVIGRGHGLSGSSGLADAPRLRAHEGGTAGGAEAAAVAAVEPARPPVLAIPAMTSQVAELVASIDAAKVRMIHGW